MNIGPEQFAATRGSNSRKTQPAMRIGEWKADPNLDEISCAARTVKVEPRTMRLLLYLAANRNRVVGLPEMLDEIWPNVVVTSQSVYSTIAQLRQILGDSTEAPRYIATVPRKGYRLIAEVGEWPDAAQVAPPPLPEPPLPDAPVAAASALAPLPAAMSAPITAAATAPVAPISSAAPTSPPASVSQVWQVSQVAPVSQAAPSDPSASTAPATQRSRSRLIWGGSVAASVLAGILLMMGYQHAHRASPGMGSARGHPEKLSAIATLPTSVAVLPFLDLSENKDFGYFADGLTEELIDSLAHNTSLRVPARTSSFYFKDKAVPVAEIASQLNVTDLLEGSVRRSGNTVRITVQLIRAQDGYHLWSETYDREAHADLAIEDDIARQVAEILRAKLTPRAQSGVPDTLDNESSNLLLECQAYLSRNTPDDTMKSLACFQKLVAANPGSARSWARYANALLHKRGLVEEPDAQRRNDLLASENAARRALQLDPDSAAAHAALAQIFMYAGRNWDGAKMEIDAALKSDPNDPLALLAATRLAEIMGRLDELLALCAIARERDPLNFLPYARATIAYMTLGRYQDAEASARRRLDISPDGSGGRTDLALALLMQGRAAEALTENAREIGPRARLVGDAMIYQAMGRHAESDAAFNELLQKCGKTNPMYIAEVRAYRGDADGAFAALNAGVSAGLNGVYIVKADFPFNALRADPRYHQLLQRMNLPD